MPRFDGNGKVVNYNPLTGATSTIIRDLFRAGYRNKEILDIMWNEHGVKVPQSTLSNLKRRLIRDRELVLACVPYPVTSPFESIYSGSSESIEETPVSLDEFVESPWSKLVSSKEFQRLPDVYIPVPAVFRKPLLSGDVDLETYMFLHDEALRRHISYEAALKEYLDGCPAISEEPQIEVSSDVVTSLESPVDEDDSIEEFLNVSLEDPAPSLCSEEPSLPISYPDFSDETRELSPVEKVETVIWEQLSRSAQERDLNAVSLFKCLLETIQSEARSV